MTPRGGGTSLRILGGFLITSLVVHLIDTNGVNRKQAVEKASPALLRSISSLQRISKYAFARRFLVRLASEAF